MTKTHLSGWAKRISFFACVLLLLSLPAYMRKADKDSQTAMYDKAAVVAEHHSDLDSNLSVFPDQIGSGVKNVTYYCHLDRGLFDTDAVIILRCSYTDEAFAQEEARLGAISMTIRSGSQSAENKIRYDEASYRYPAYIAIDGFDHAYEYALLMRENKEIAYVYLSYPGEETLKDREDLMKKDLSQYKVPPEDAFSLYNHSFDGGKSYVEFDD